VANSNVNSGYVASFEKAEALDDVTVRLTFSQPDARVPQAFVPIVPKHIWGNLTTEELTTYNPCCPMIGSGPWMVTKLDKKGTTILERNPYFREPPGPIERILMTKYESKEAQLRDSSSTSSTRSSRPT
jgi:ABC-type transport system substrate-binding protein